MRKKLILIGGGGHCRSCIDVIETQGTYQVVGILDIEEKVGSKVSGYSVVGTDDDIDIYISRDYYFLITLGQIESSTVRERIYSKLKRQNAKLATVVSPYACVSKHASIDEGTIVMHGAIVNSHAKVGYNCIVNSNALIEHDAEVREHCHISTGALVNGSVLVNRGSFCGSGCIVVQESIVPVNSFIKAGVRFSKVNRCKTAFLTTLFPLEERFLEDFMKSLVNQTTSDFDLIVINDGYGDLSKLIATYPELNIIELPSEENIASNRASLVNFSRLNKYQYAIFGDADDYFPSDRVDTSINYLKTTDVLVSDFTTFNEEGVIDDLYLSHRFNNGDVICIEDILEKNFFGFTNTAINLYKIADTEFDFNKDLIAVDWYFFSNLLLMGLSARFTNDTQTYYRQHVNNTIGINKDCEKELESILNVKKVHYREMKKQYYDEYSVLYNKSLMFDRENLNTYVETTPYPLWWEKLLVQEL